jgi:hypothetical protein
LGVTEITKLLTAENAEKYDEIAENRIRDEFSE